MQLNYKTFGEGAPLIILHGLFGSLDNWQTIAKKLAANFKVFIVDQRNHGGSPHTVEFSYKILSDDLLEFIDNQHIDTCYLIGHSMGGKTAMEFALTHAERADKLIIVDIAPAAYNDQHGSIFNALFAADVKHHTNRKDVENVLRNKLNNDIATVQFLMKGLHRRIDLGLNGFEWKFNLESLYKNYTQISGAVNSPNLFTGPTLFIKGEKSDYINSGNYGSIVQLFPNHQIAEIKGAGHWVQSEKPVEFVQEVMKFLV